MKQSGLTVAIIGLGRIGRIHLNTVKNHEDVDRILVCSPSMPADLTVDHEAITYYNDHNLLLNSEMDIDAVLICSPTSYHYQMILDFAQQGLDIFCEKPVSLDLSEIINIKNVVDRSKIKLQVGFNRRFDPDFSKLQERIATGDIGDLHQLLIISRDPAPPPLSFIKDSGGLFFDMSIHDFDMARYLVGSEVKEVFATGDVRIDDSIKKYNDIDTATVMLRFQNGLICTIMNSRKAIYGYDQRIEAFGSGGILKVNNKLQDRIEHWGHDQLHSSKPMHFFLERYEISYAIEIQQFIKDVVDDRACAVGYHDALQSIKIAIAASESLKSNQVISVK